jgi:DNA polymerase (family 10)
MTGVFSVAQLLVDTLASFCDRIEMAGSLRRDRPMIGDIEIVAIPKRPTDLLGVTLFDVGTMLDAFLYPRYQPAKNGPKYKQFKYGEYQVDLFLPTPETWGAVFMIRTGSHEFNMWVMTEVCRRAGKRFADGRVYDWQANELETPEEVDVFDALGLPWIPPSERDDDKWRKRAGR